jgi:microcystin-dependent protein
MSDPFVGEIKMFGGNFPPSGWALCQGQLLPISENETLFQLIGTTYGGDGQSTFALPDLASRVAVHQGQGPGITQSYVLGQKAGVESVTLSTQQIPIHTHAAVTTTTGQVSAAPGNILADAQTTQTGPRIYSTQASDVNMNAATIAISGGSQPHDNFQPTLAINFIISLFGIFPSQN